MDVAAIDQVRLNFNPQGLMVINAAIGLMMLGVALDLKLSDFRRIMVAPKAPLIGMAAQFLLLPALTFVLTNAGASKRLVVLGRGVYVAREGRRSAAEDLRRFHRFERRVEALAA